MTTPTEDQILATFNAAVAAAESAFRVLQRAASEARLALSLEDRDGALDAYGATMRPAREARDAAIQAARVAAGWD
jgi:hypothetical protein